MKKLLTIPKIQEAALGIAVIALAAGWLPCRAWKRNAAVAVAVVALVAELPPTTSTMPSPATKFPSLRR